MLTFERVTAQHLRSNTGFEILPGGRFATIYRENNRDMEVELEYGRADSGSVCVTVQPGAFSKWADGTSVMSLDEQLRIEANFRAAMAFDDIELVIWDHDRQKYLDHTA